MKLEPIAYDASLHQRYVSDIKVSNLTDGFTEELLKKKLFIKIMKKLYLTSVAN